MAKSPAYKRILVKLSGECFNSAENCGVDASAGDRLASELLPVIKSGVRVAFVVGGGNIIRGGRLVESRIRRTTADYMGMLATVINALALRDILEHNGAAAVVMSAIPMGAICESFCRDKALEYLDAGKAVIFAAGTGNPYFTTDTCAALRASEIGAEALIKATKVDGVFDSDPMKNPAAKKYDRLTYQKAITDQLGVMDLTAISMCMENRIPIIVLELFRPGNLVSAVAGKGVGTLVSN